jgi:hypothetical protein
MPIGISSGSPAASAVAVLPGSAETWNSVGVFWASHAAK